jgi:hypothetical protein
VTRALAQPAVVGHPPDQDVSVEEQPHGSGPTFERFQDVIRKRQIEILLDADLPA